MATAKSSRMVSARIHDSLDLAPYIPGTTRYGRFSVYFGEPRFFTGLNTNFGRISCLDRHPDSGTA